MADPKQVLECIRSGQVPSEDIPHLVAETPGLLDLILGIADQGASSPLASPLPVGDEGGQVTPPCLLPALTPRPGFRRSLAGALRRAGDDIEQRVTRRELHRALRRNEKRAAMAETMIATGQDTVASGHALIDRGQMILNEIETGTVQAPRPASWWKTRQP